MSLGPLGPLDIITGDIITAVAMLGRCKKGIGPGAKVKADRRQPQESRQKAHCFAVCLPTSYLSRNLAHPLPLQ